MKKYFCSMLAFSLCGSAVAQEISAVPEEIIVSMQEKFKHADASQKKQVLRFFQAHPASGKYVKNCFTPDQIAEYGSSKNNDESKAVSATSLTSLQTEEQVNSVSWKDSNRLMTTLNDTGFAEWDIDAKKVIRTVDVNHAKAGAYNNDKTRLAILTTDSMEIYDATSYNKIQDIPLQKNESYKLIWDAQGKKLIAYDDIFGKSFYVVDTNDHSIARFDCQLPEGAFLMAAAWSDDNESICSVAGDGKVVRWNPTTNEHTTILELADQEYSKWGLYALNKDTVAHVSTSIDDTKIKVGITSIKTRNSIFERIEKSEPYWGQGHSMELSNDNQIELAGATSMLLFDKQEAKASSIGYPFSQICCAFSPDNSRVAVGLSVADLLIFDLKKAPTRSCRIQ